MSWRGTDFANPPYTCRARLDVLFLACQKRPETPWLPRDWRRCSARAGPGGYGSRNLPLTQVAVEDPIRGDGMWTVGAGAYKIAVTEPVFSVLRALASRSDRRLFPRPSAERLTENDLQRRLWEALPVSEHTETKQGPVQLR